MDFVKSSIVYLLYFPVFHEKKCDDGICKQQFDSGKV